MTLHGPDISRYQDGINLKTTPGDLVIVGTSDGSIINPAADRQIQAGKAAGKLIGVYHYFRNDPLTEARFWAAHTKGYQDGKTVFFLDAETAHPNLPNLCVQFANEFKRLTGIKVVIYTYWHLLQAYNWQTCVSNDLALWGAWYPLGNTTISGYNPPARQDAPYWGKAMVGWQYTSAGRLPGWGGDLDLNIFYIDKAGWMRLAAKNGAVSTPPATVKPQGNVKPPAPAKPAPAPSGTFVATVDAGDSLSSIAAQFGTTVAAILAVNKIPDPNKIYPGQKLNIPRGKAAPTQPSGPAVVTVDPGDTLSGIAAQFKVPLAQIIRANPGINPDLIYPGQKIRLR